MKTLPNMWYALDARFWETIRAKHLEELYDELLCLRQKLFERFEPVYYDIKIESHEGELE